MAPKRTLQPEPFETRLRRTGSAAGVTIPAEFLRQLGIEVGDTLQVEIDGESFRIRKLDQDYDLFMDLYEFVEDRFAPSLHQMED
ncbi:MULTISPECIES: AbrB/MazE/SpoVT family DNA-binding domain-containing protein [Sneathiella]|uniref:AbrB/MazE/SpoVT family DNA-binding domain-containing protein n=1 Tax=Sneathiella TaxID=510690 RepID=UPI00146DC129|nr:AbrB/MazE/SpoVT family DNA-binding domain-containing protein [Sneathiella aquimaris]